LYIPEHHDSDADDLFGGDEPIAPVQKHMSFAP